MANRLLLATLLTIVYGVAIFGRLIIKPLNQIGSSRQITMNCSSTLGSNAITWTLIPANKTLNVTIATGSTVYSSLTQLYGIDQPTANESNLIIRSPNASVGTWTCADNDMLARAQLLAWYNIRAHTNTSGTIVIGDVIIFSCQMVYLGNPFFQIQFRLTRVEYPILAWTVMDNSTLPQLEISNSTITATVNFYQIASCLLYREIQCNAQVQQPIMGNLLPGSSTNGIYSAASTNFYRMNVSCVPSITGAISGALINSGAKLTCQLTSKLPVNYSWIDLTYGNSSVGPQLTVWHDGSYQCNASFAVSGQLQSVSATVYNLTVASVAIRGRLIITPRNQFTAGTQVIMNCSSTLGSSAIIWTFIPANQSVNATIASGSTVYPPFTQLYWIDQPTTNDSNLIIRKPNASTAGTFTCSDNEMLARAELLVFYNMTEITNASGTVIIGDVIEYLCQIVYIGNPFFPLLFLLERRPPYANWYTIDNSTSYQLEKSNSTITATVKFYQMASSLSYQPTWCHIYFNQPTISNFLPGSSTYAPTSNIASGFVPVNVLSVPSITGAISGALLNSGAKLTCQLTSKLPVNYSWIDLTYGNSSVGPQLTVWHSGSYQCNASFAVSGQWQSVSATVYNLTVASVPSIAGAVSGSMVYFGARLTCQLPSQLSVYYMWTDLTYGNWSVGPELTVLHSGSYQCHASSYGISGQWKSTSATVYNLTVESVPSITGAVSGSVLYFGARLTCHLPSQLSVNYLWTDLTYGNWSVGPQLNVLHSGSYQCNASSYDMCGRWQSISTAVYNLTVV